MTNRKSIVPQLRPFPNFAALDGCHCVTSSMARIFHFAGHPLSEEMLLGLGAGMGFIYWRMKFAGTEIVFVGGRGNLKGFYQDVASRTGVVIREKQTGSAAKAESELLRMLAMKQPVMLGADMGFLPWFKLPADYHFGGHTFVACGWDGGATVLGSDIDQKASGAKKGFVAPILLDQLRKARSSPFKPFPPRNLRLEFEFSGFREPGAQDIAASIRQTVNVMLHPPIRNFGVRGIRHTADELLEWPDQFGEHDLRMNLFNLYVFIEIGGTGGGCFRPMYSRFLRQSADITRNRALAKCADEYKEIGERFTRIGIMFKSAQTMKNLQQSVRAAAAVFREIANREESACMLLEKSF
jgi:Domain of unknown function (DUF4872)/Butirosin biosynthesis protein H, N-terminal